MVECKMMRVSVGVHLFPDLVERYGHVRLKKFKQFKNPKVLEGQSDFEIFAKLDLMVRYFEDMVAIILDQRDIIKIAADELKIQMEDVKKESGDPITTLNIEQRASFNEIADDDEYLFNILKVIRSDKVSQDI